MKEASKTLSSSRMKALWPCHSATPKSASKLSVIVYQGISQPICAFRRAISACGARGAGAEGGSRGVKRGEGGGLVRHHGTADTGMAGPAMHAGLEERAVHDQLAASGKQVEQACFAFGSVELIGGFHGDPWHSPSLGGECVPGAGQGLFLHQKL